MTTADWWSNSEDDDLQKALRASLAEMEGGHSGARGVDVSELGESDDLPEAVTEAYQKVVRVWERDKRIYWKACDTALEHAIEQRASRGTLFFVNQMVPEIVSICLQECTWADIVEDAVTKEDYTDTFTRILHSCVEVCVGAVKQGSADLMASLIMLLDPMAQLYTKHARTSLSNVDCPPSPTLLQSLVQHASSLDGPAMVLGCLEHWPWNSVLPGMRFLRLCDVDLHFEQALGVLQQRILARGIDVWRDDGRALGDIFSQLSSDSLFVGSKAADALCDIGRQVAAVAVQGSRSEKFMERAAALPAMVAVIQSKALVAEDGTGACHFLDEQGVLEDLFGERAHERIIQEAAPLLRAMELTPARLDIILTACFNAHDDSLAAAASSVIVALVESADATCVLHVLMRCETAIADDLPTAPAAFNLSMQLITARAGERSGAHASSTAVSLALSSKPMILTCGVVAAQAALRLCCQAACSPLAVREEVLTGATEALHEMLKADGSAVFGTEEKQHLRDFVLTYCIDVLRKLQDGLQRRWSPTHSNSKAASRVSDAAAALPASAPAAGGGAGTVTARTPQAASPTSTDLRPGPVDVQTPKREGAVGAPQGATQGEEMRYRIQARALYAILRSVIDMHPLVCTSSQRRSRPMCIAQLQKDHNIVQHIIDDVKILAASLATGSASSSAEPRAALARSNSQTQFLKAVARPLQKRDEGIHRPQARSRWSFLGSECWARLEFLRFFLETSDAGLKLSAPQALCVWEALCEESCEAACCWFMVLQDAGGLLEHAASEAIFKALLQLPHTAYTSLHVLDCFLSLFVDINAANTAGNVRRDSGPVLQVSGRDGKRPGGRLSGQGLVGKRIAVRSSEDNKMHPATVTGYDAMQWLKHSLVWDADGEEVQKSLDDGDSSYLSTEWTLVCDEMCLDAQSLHLSSCRDWLQLQGVDTLWNAALSVVEDAVAAKAGSIIQQLMLCLQPGQAGTGKSLGEMFRGRRMDEGESSSVGLDSADGAGGSLSPQDAEMERLEIEKLMVSLFGEVEKAAREVYQWEDLSVRELRKRARSLSLEMHSDKEGQERGSPGAQRPTGDADAVYADVTAALMAPIVNLAPSAGADAHERAALDSVSADIRMGDGGWVDGAGKSLRLQRCLELMARLLCEQRGAQAHSALSRARAVATGDRTVSGPASGSMASASEQSGYVDMSDKSVARKEMESAEKAREEGNRQRLGAALNHISEECGHYYDLLLVILETRSTIPEVRDLVWKVLMQLPTQREKYASIQDQHFTRWSGVLGPETGPWRSLYSLQIVDAMLLPGDNDAVKLRRAVDWRRRFLLTGGLEQLVAFAMTVDKHPSWHDRQPLARSVCLPLLARILKSCVAGALSDIKALHASSGAGGASGGRSLGIPPSPGLRAIASSMLPPEDAASIPPVGKVQGALGQRSGGGDTRSSAGQAMVIDMGLMTRQLLSFLVQDIVVDNDEHRAGNTQALTDGLSVIRQLLCAGGAGTPALLPQPDANGASILIGHSIIDTFFSKGCADDLIDGILLSHPQHAVRCSAKQLLNDLAVAAVPPDSRDSTTNGEAVLVRIMSQLQRRLVKLDQSTLVAAQFFELLSDFALEIIQAQTRSGGGAGGGAGGSMVVLQRTNALSAASVQLTELQDALLALLDKLDSRCEDAFVCDALLCIERIATASLSFQHRLVEQGIVTRLLREFLMNVPDSVNIGQNPFCQEPASREAAWRIVRMLVSLNPGSLGNEVVSMINSFLRNVRLPLRVDGSEDWQHKLEVQKRKGLPFIGLRNPGARCYMNSMLQMLHDTDEFRECVQAAGIAAHTDKDEDDETWACAMCTMRNGWDVETCDICGTGKRPEKPQDKVPHGEVLRQLRRTMMFMQHSELCSFDGADMMKACKDIGMHKAIELQNDTTEFFQRLLERLETEVAGPSIKPLQRCFRARMLTQRVSAECVHAKPPSCGPYEKAINVGVAGMGSLEKALSALTKPLLITGGNRIVCEECSAAAGATVRRAYWEYSVLERGSLSSTLVFNLKRFTVRASQGGTNVKINDFLSFPLTLDLAPYTRSAAQGADPFSSFSPPTSPAGGGAGEVAGAAEAERCGKREEPLLYHLRGVIVHKGEASHGHYYAFMHKPGMGWFRVDDEKVVSFDLDKGLVHKPCSSTPIGPALPTGGAGSGLGAAGREVSGFAVGGGKGLEGLAALAEECFGGVDSASKVRAGKKARNHNAFVLFYERTSDSGTHPPMAGIEDVNSSSSSDAAHSPAPHATDAEKAVKELQSALQSLPDHRDYGTHPDLEEVLDTNFQNMCREILFDPSFSGQVLDFIEAQLQLNAVSADDLLCMGITLLMRVVLRSAEPPRVDDWRRVLTSPAALPARPTACKWLLERLVEPHTPSGMGMGDTEMSDSHALAADSSNGGSGGASGGASGSDWCGKRWLDGLLIDCPLEASRSAFCDILLCAVHTWCASAQVDALTADGPVGCLVQGLLNLFPAEASNPVNLDTYLALWAGLARKPPPEMQKVFSEGLARKPPPAVLDAGHTDRDNPTSDANCAGAADKGQARTCEASKCAALLGSMRVPYLLAHLYLGAASTDASMPRIANVGGLAKPEPNAELLLGTINIVMQATEVSDKVLGVLTAPIISKLALLGPASGDAGDGVGLLTRLCSNTTLLRQAVQTLLAGIRSAPTHYDNKEQTLESQRADAIQLLLSAHTRTETGEEARERVQVIMTMLTDEANTVPSAADMSMSPGTSPISPSRIGVGGGSDGGSNLVLLKRLSKMVVVASRVPRALVWLQENRGRWRWMQRAIEEQHRRADQRSTSFVGLVRDLNEIAGYCDKTAVRVVGAGDELVNGAYRLVRNPVSGKVQYSRLVGDQEYTIWRDPGAAPGARGGGGWVISCGARAFYSHAGLQQGYFSSIVGRMGTSDRDALADNGPPEDGWQVKGGKHPAPRVMGLDSSDTPPPPSPIINFARLRVQRLEGDQFTLILSRRPLLCHPSNGAVSFGGEGQPGTALTILNDCGLAEAAAGTPVCVAEASTTGTSDVRVLTLRPQEGPEDGVPVSPLAPGKAAAAVMSQKLNGNHRSQMMVLHHTGLLVCDDDDVWWQLQADEGGWHSLADRGGLFGGLAAAVFVPHRGNMNFLGSSPVGAAGGGGGVGGGSFLPALTLGR